MVCERECEMCVWCVLWCGESDCVCLRESLCVCLRDSLCVCLRESVCV